MPTRPDAEDLLQIAVGTAENPERGPAESGRIVRCLDGADSSQEHSVESSVHIRKRIPPEFSIPSQLQLRTTTSNRSCTFTDFRPSQSP